MDEKRMWRKVLAANHPDAGGDEEVFKFLSDLRDERLGKEPARPPRPGYPPTTVIFTTRPTTASGAAGFRYGDYSA